MIKYLMKKRYEVFDGNTWVSYSILLKYIEIIKWFIMRSVKKINVIKDS